MPSMDTSPTSNSPFAYITGNDLDHQAEWAAETFGPGQRVKGLIEHIRKELDEIEANPSDIMEWVDLIVLAIDGATRQDYTGDRILNAYLDKMQENYLREWPDWRNFSEDEPIEHIR